jgi:hypothetical protein
MSSLRFSEHLAGFVSTRETDFNQAWLEGMRNDEVCTVDLDIAVDDVNRFIDDPEHTASATGHLDCAALGGRLAVVDGMFNLFVEEQDRRKTRMRYRLFVVDPQNRPLTFSAFKVIVDDPNFDAWTDTTTLFVRIFDGHVDNPDDLGARATGILKLSRLGFLRLLTTLETGDGSRSARAAGLARFGRLFLGELWTVYGGRAALGGQPDFPAFPRYEGDPFHGHVPGQWHDVDRRPGLQRRIVPFVAGDGFEGTLHQIRGAKTPTKGPIVLVHGTGVRADLFYGHPGPQSLVQHLVDVGYDVWLENWRGSIDFAPHPYTLDEAAAYDHPAAVRTVLDETGHESMKALVHCQGSTSWVISAVAGLVPEVKTVVSSAVSMHPRVPWQSRLKMTALVPALGMGTPYIDAQWGGRSPTLVARGIAAWASLMRRHDCDDPICHLANYMYGFGKDVLWVHENLDPETHHWTSREFGYAPIRFLKQIRRSVLAGHLVNVDGLRALPSDYVAAGPPEGQRWTFIAGSRNRLFLPSSQQITYEWFDAAQPGVHAHHLFPGYGHLDLLFGKNARDDTFDTIVAALDRN